MPVVISILIVLGVVIAFAVLTKRGRNISIATTYGKIIQDYGEIGQSFVGKKPYFGSNQSLRLLKCQRNEEEFFLIETKNTNFASFDVHYTALSKDTSNALVNIIALLK